MYDAQGLIGIVDMWWESLGVVGEADGAVKYDERQVLYQEKVREDRIRAKGLRFVRWGWEDTKLRMDWVAEQIRSAARRPAKQTQTLIGLGLNKLHRTRELEDTPSVRGMINKVKHLVRVDGETG